MKNNAAPAIAAPRLLSLDALRGLDMLIICGIDVTARALAQVHPGDEFWQAPAEWFTHVDWEGLHAYDLVFPLFVFISGISMSFSMGRPGRSVWRLLGKLWSRAVVLVLLGMLVNGALSWDFEQMRVASVLGLIGISGAIGGTVVLLMRRNVTAVAVAALAMLAGVWAAQYYGGDMTREGCVNAYLDQLLLPGRFHLDCVDPEGLLCLVSAGVMSLAGYLTGRLLSTAKTVRVVCTLGISGALLIAAGFCGPVIKNIWTPWFVMVAAGISAWLVLLFHLIIDLPRLERTSLPLRVVGMNALFIYLLVNVIPFHQLAYRVFGGFSKLWLSEQWQPVGLGVSMVLLAWLICFYMYRKSIFIKV